MRLTRLLPAIAAALLAAFAAAQEPPPQPLRSEATLFYPRTVARAEERSYAGTATWRAIELGPTRAIEAVLSFAGVDADMIVVIEENPFRELPDDVLIHAWPQMPATAEGPAVASAYVVGVETPDDAQIGLIATARGDWTVGLLAAAAERNHARLDAARVVIVELGLPDGKAYVGISLGEEEQRLLAGVIPVGDLAFALADPVEQRILGANAPGGTGGVLWDTPNADGAATVRGRVFLYDTGIGFSVVFATTPDGLVVSVMPDTPESPFGLGNLVGVSVRTPAGEVAIAGGEAAAAGGATGVVFPGAAASIALGMLRGDVMGVTMVFAGPDGTETPVAAALPQAWNPFAFLPPRP